LTWPAVPPGAVFAPAQSLTDTSTMSPSSLVQEAAPLMGGNTSNFSGAQTEQPLQGTDGSIPSFPAAETFPGPAVQQAPSGA